LSVAVFVLVRMLQYRDAGYFTTIIISCGHFLLCQVIVPAQEGKNASPPGRPMHDLRTSKVVAKKFWKNLRQQDCPLTVWRWFNGFLSSCYLQSSRVVKTLSFQIANSI
jgi:hypothetical protein